MSNNEDVKRNRELIEHLKRRKHQREIQLAQQGVNADPIIRTEIEDIDKWLFMLREEIAKAIEPKHVSAQDTKSKMSVRHDVAKQLAVVSNEQAIRNLFWNNIMPYIIGRDAHFYQKMWTKHFKLRADEIPRQQLRPSVEHIIYTDEIRRLVKNYCLSCDLFELYQFTLFLLNDKYTSSGSVAKELNIILENEGSKYRYQDDTRNKMFVLLYLE